MWPIDEWQNFDLDGRPDMPQNSRPEKMPMRSFPTTRLMSLAFCNSTCFRAAAWSLVAALLLPSVPARACHCSDSRVHRCCCDFEPSESANGSPRSCCSPRNEGQAKGTSTCCHAHRASELANVQPCCHSGGELAHAIPESSCGCGLACRCQVSEPGESQPIQAPSPDESRTQRIQPLECTLSIAAMTLPSPLPVSNARHPESTIAATSLDRCISLSRFIC
jgi:hypothetical protein